MKNSNDLQKKVLRQINGFEEEFQWKLASGAKEKQRGEITFHSLQEFYASDFAELKMTAINSYDNRANAGRDFQKILRPINNR